MSRTIKEEIVEIKKYVFADGNVVEMFPIKDVIGYTHRIIINGVSVRSWLAHHQKPSKDVARYFYNKHIHGAK